MMEGKKGEVVDLFQKAIDSKPEFYIRAYENMKKAKATLNAPQRK